MLEICTEIIGKLEEGIRVELRGLRRLQMRLQEECSLVSQQLEEARNIKKESDSLRSVLGEVIRRNQWWVDDDAESEPSILISYHRGNF